MSRMREDLTYYAETGVLSASAYEEGLRLAGETPDAAAWRGFIDRLLVVSGALLVSVGVIFFVAFNWQALGRYAKFGLLEALVLLPTLFALVAGLATVRAKAALLCAVLVLGGLLALLGQTYQTGADNYELFLAWAALALPWVLAGRWAPLWAVWWSLVNLALALYLFQVLDPLRQLLWGHMQPGAVALLNLLGLAVFEWAYARVDSLRNRWLARYCVLLALGAATFGALMFVLDDHDKDNGATFAIYCAMIPAGAWFYQTVRRDLFPLACGALSLIIVVTAWLGDALFHTHGDFGGFTLLAAVVIGGTIAATLWLRGLNRKWDVLPAAGGESGGLPA